MSSEMKLLYTEEVFDFDPEDAVELRRLVDLWNKQRNITEDVEVVIYKAHYIPRFSSKEDYSYHKIEVFGFGEFLQV